MHIELTEAVLLDRRVNDTGLFLLRAITPDDLTRPTPCAEWSLGDLMEHMIAQHHGFAAAAGDAGGDEEAWRVQPLGDDPVGSYATSVDEVNQAFASVDSDTPFMLPEAGPDPVPARQALSMHLVDGIVHGWDLVKTLGSTVEFGDDVLEAGWRIASTVPDGDFRAEPGSPFARAVEVDESAATLDRIVAALGRSPNWSPAKGG